MGVEFIILIWMPECIFEYGTKAREVYPRAKKHVGESLRIPMKVSGYIMKKDGRRMAENRLRKLDGCPPCALSCDGDYSVASCRGVQKQQVDACGYFYF